MRDRMIAVNNAESSCNPKIHSIVTDWRWPLVKLFALSGKKNRDLMSKKFAVESHKSTKLEEFHTIENRLAKKVTENSIVMIKMNSKCTLWNGQNHFHRFFNSLQSMYPNSGKIVEWGWSDQICKDSARHGRQCVASFMRFKTCSIKYDKFSNNDKSSLEEFNVRLLRSGIEPFNLDQLSVFLSNVKNYAQTLASLLKKTKPKAILTTCCFDSIEGFAISLAGSKANIPVIDFQHGQQGPDHSFYCHWPHIPMQGYSSLPSHFWVWGKLTAKNIGRWNKKHGAIIVGGNPWLQMRIEKSRKSDIKISSQHSQQITVLVALQTFVIPEHLLLLVKQMEKQNIHWIFRPHPIFGTIADTFEILSKIPPTKWSIDDSDDSMNSLEKSDILLTSYSTMAYEGLAFGLRVGILNNIGISDMRFFIKCKYFKDASNIKLLTNVVSSKPDTEERKKNVLNSAIFYQNNKDNTCEAFQRLWNLSF